MITLIEVQELKILIIILEFMQIEKKLLNQCE